METVQAIRKVKVESKLLIEIVGIVTRLRGLKANIKELNRVRGCLLERNRKAEKEMRKEFTE